MGEPVVAIIAGAAQGLRGYRVGARRPAEPRVKPSRRNEGKAKLSEFHSKSRSLG